MNFLYPQYLYGLFAILIPIIVHYFNFQRNKKVFFSNVSFLKEVKSVSNARNRLKDYLILLMRILAITAIVFAVAQPIIPKENVHTQGASASIFLDNSYSLQNRNNVGPVFQQAKELAYTIAQQADAHGKFQFISNDFTLDQQHVYQQYELEELVANSELTGASQKLQEVVQRQKKVMQKEVNYTNYIISDFQKNQYDFSLLQKDTLHATVLVPVTPTKKRNLAIDSVWFEQPFVRLNTVQNVHFRVRNYSNQAQYNVSAQIEVGKNEKNMLRLEVPAWAQVDTFFQIKLNEPGWFNSKITIQDNPVTFDNAYYFSFLIQEHIEVRVINGSEPSKKVASLFNLEPYFDLKEYGVQEVNVEDLSSAQFVVLNNVSELSSGLQNVLIQFVENGGTVCVFPPLVTEKNNMNSWLGAMKIPALQNTVKDSTLVTEINTTHPLFSSVFKSTSLHMALPKVYQQYRLRPTQNSFSLMEDVGRNPFLLEYGVKKGKLYLFSVPLSPKNSSLPTNDILLPSLFEMAFNSHPMLPLSFLTTHEAIPVPRALVAKSEFVELTSGPVRFIPQVVYTNSEAILYPHDHILQAGNYQLMDGDSILASISFNYPLNESEMEFYDAIQLQHLIDSLQLTSYSVLDGDLNTFSAELITQNQPISLWQLFLAFALFCIAMEIVFIQFLKS